MLDGFRFADAGALGWVWAIACLAIAGWALGVRARRGLRGFAEPAMLRGLVSEASRPRRAARAALALLAMVLVVVAWARPQADPEEAEVPDTGRDVIFVLDGSRSMGATDVRPTRLERAKLWIADAMRAARGDRVGLVVYEGSAVLRAPLTRDRAFVRLVLEESEPGGLTRGGSMPGDALRVALREGFGFDLTEEEPSAPEDGLGAARVRDIVLISDGDDHGSAPVEAARLAGQLGVRLVAVGVGSEAGAPIPRLDAAGRRVGFVTDERGERVISALDGSVLRPMAAATPGGVYLPAGDGVVDMADVYRRLIDARDAEGARDTARQLVYREGFQIPLAAALVLLMIEGLVSERRRRR